MSVDGVCKPSDNIERARFVRNDNAKFFESGLKVGFFCCKYNLRKQPKCVLKAFVTFGEVQTELSGLTCGCCNFRNIATGGEHADYPTPRRRVWQSSVKPLVTHNRPVGTWVKVATPLPRGVNLTNVVASVDGSQGIRDRWHGQVPPSTAAFGIPNKRGATGSLIGSVYARERGVPNLYSFLVPDH